MIPNMLELIGPGFLNQFPTLSVLGLRDLGFRSLGCRAWGSEFRL